MIRTNVFRVQSFESGVSVKGVSTRVEIRFDPVSKSNDGTVDSQLELYGKSDQVGFAKFTECLRVWPFLWRNHS